MADNKGRVLISEGITANCLTLYIINLSVVVRYDYEEPKIYAFWTYFMADPSVNVVVIVPSQMITNYRPFRFCHFIKYCTSYRYYFRHTSITNVWNFEAEKSVLNFGAWIDIPSCNSWFGDQLCKCNLTLWRLTTYIWVVPHR